MQRERKRQPGVCEHCGRDFMSRVDRPQRFCGRPCADINRKGFVIERILRRVVCQTDSQCWEWTGHRLPLGYGTIKHLYRHHAVHRVVWTHYHGPIPDGLLVLHECDNPPCCNPDHLHLGTHTDNMREKVARQRHRMGEAHHTARLTDVAVVAMRKLRADGWGYERLATLFEMPLATVREACIRKTWKHLP